MTKIILLAMVTMTIPLVLFGHQGSLRGKVFDAQTGAPMVAANITLANSTQGTYSDEFGSFKFENLEAGTYEVEVSYLGYDRQRQEVIIRDNESLDLSFFLVSTRLDLAEVNISSARQLEINTINTLNLAMRPINNSQDVLRNIPGLFIAQHAGGGKAEQIFLRGFDIDHGTDINLSADGMPVNMVSHAHGQGYSDLHFIIPETIDRVNFNKGPYYADKGDFTTAGYASFNTKEFLDKNMVKVGLGQFNTLRTVGMFRLLDRERQQAYIASEFNLTDGYFESSQNFHRINLLAKYTGFVTADNKITLQTSLMNSRWDASGQIPTRAVESGTINRFGSIDSTEGGETQRINLSVKSDKRLNDRDWVSNQLYFVKYDFELFSNFTFFLEDSINGDQIRQREDRKIYGYNGSFHSARKIFGIPLKSEIGLNLRFDQVEGIELSHTANRLTTLNNKALGDIGQFNAGGYVNENLFISNHLRLNLGLRYDYFDFQYNDHLHSNYSRQSHSTSLISPKAAVFYSITNNVEVFAKMGMGFHSNDARVVVAQEGQQVIPRAYGSDVGAEFKIGRRIIVQTTLWLLDLEQEFVYVGDEAIVEPAGYTRRLGVDLSARAQLLEWLYADLDLNLTRSRILNAEKGEYYVPLAPNLTSIGGLTCNFKNGINGSLRYRYLGDRPANEDYSLTARGYFLMDGLVNYTTSKFEVGLSLQNILNTQWLEAQFETASKLKNEPLPSTGIHYTPGTPRYIQLHFSLFF